MFTQQSWVTQPQSGVIVPGAVAWLNGQNATSLPKSTLGYQRVGSPTIAASAYGQSLNYAGSQYLYSDVQVLNNTLVEATLIALVQVTSFADNSTFLSVNNATTSSTLFRILYSAGDAKFMFQARDAVEFAFTNLVGTTTPVLGTWYVVAAVYRNGSQSIYVNGRLEASSSVTLLDYSFNRVCFGTLDRGGAIQTLVGRMPFGAIYPKAFTPSQLGQIRAPKDVWKLFAPQPRRIWSTLSGANTYTITPSGGVVFSGTIPLRRERRQVPSGGLTFSGAVALRRERQVIPSGTVNFSGTAAIIFNTPNIYTITPSGGAVFSGAAALRRTRLLSATGTVNFSGTVPLLRARLLAPTGKVTFQGSAGIVFIPAGGLPYVPSTRITVGSARSTRIS